MSHECCSWAYQGLQFVTVLFLRVSWCFVFFAWGTFTDIHWSTTWCCEPCDCRWIPILSWVFRGFIPIRNGSRAYSEVLLASADLKKAVNCEPSWPWKEQKSGVICVLDVLWHDHHSGDSWPPVEFVPQQHVWTFRGRLRGLTVRHHLPRELWRVQA